MERPHTAKKDLNREVPPLPPPPPMDAGARLYPDVSAPPGSVPQLDQPLIGHPTHPMFPHQPMANRLPPIHRPFDATAGTNGPPPYCDPHPQQNHPFGGCGQGQHVGVRYFVHGPPQMSEFHAIHTVPGGGVNPSGCSAQGGGLSRELKPTVNGIVFRVSLLLCLILFGL